MMRNMKHVLTALLVGVVILSGVSFAEAGVKLDDIQIFVRMKDEKQPSKLSNPPHHWRPEVREPHWNKPHRPGPHGGHALKPLHGPGAPHGPKHGFHGGPNRLRKPGRDVPPPSPRRR